MVKSRKLVAALTRLAKVDPNDENIAELETAKQDQADLIESLQHPKPPLKKQKSSIDALTCPICHDALVYPCTLACGHSACQQCLLEYFETRDGSEVQCMTCRDPVPRSIPAVNVILRQLVIAKIAKDCLVQEAQVREPLDI